MRSFTKKPGLPKNPPSLAKSILLIILFTFGIVALFGLIIFMLLRGGQQLGLSPAGYLAILIVTTGIFAWLVKRISDTVSGMSDRWFPPDSDKPD